MLWTIYDNINKWFDTLKLFFVDKGFARIATAEDNVEGELFFLPSQLHCILNLDKSEVLTDGTTKLAGARPVTELLSSDTALPKGATSTNKSGYSADAHGS